MKALTIQLVLILVTLGIAFRVMSGTGARTQAVRRLGMLVFAGFAVWSILSPGVWTTLAHAVGIGRGTDLILYGDCNPYCAQARQVAAGLDRDSVLSSA